MSSLHDPFDLIKADKDMDNISPFLAQNKIDQMVNTALAHPQLAPRKTGATRKTLWSGGLATAACLILLLTFFSPSQISIPQNTIAAQMQGDDLNEFSELVMLDTWESY